ncbi:transcriptional regulator FtsR [Gulosibacter bifidus]|uniref:MerR family transcriptional regulator n=1 Tax=Gulosibacter bifidus TaxID=272239 RepID=A0ABW5RG45_9MICO|nr:MerR family transcriptional regulator [Gulosibacter bifidus]
MSSVAIRSGASGSIPKLSIGQVLQRLASEHPELTPSKIRFLEEQGLVHPARTAAGYRKFSESDVQRIRTVLSLQRDHYLPLKVIGEYLDAIDRGETPPVPGVAPAATSSLTTGTPLTREELLRRSGASRELLDSAHSAGLIVRTTRYGDDELALLTTLVTLDRNGIQPRHLRPFRTAMQHELGLIEQVVNPMLRKNSKAAREQAERKMVELSQALQQVRGAMLSQGMRDRRQS